MTEVVTEPFLKIAKNYMEKTIEEDVTEPKDNILKSTINTDHNPWKEFEMLTSVISKYPFTGEKGIFPVTVPPTPMNVLPTTTTATTANQSVNDHRISCHRCGNIRKRKTVCCRTNCPHTFCGRCSDKLRLEYGPEVFTNGCPVCKDLCCCSNKSVNCTRKFHCYRKCPATKVTPKATTKVISFPDPSPSPTLTKPTDSSVDESTSVEDNHSSSSTTAMKKELGLNALLEACESAHFNPLQSMNTTEKKRKRSKFEESSSSPSLTSSDVPLTGMNPLFCAPVTKQSSSNKKEKKQAASAIANNSSGMPSVSPYSLPFYGFPPGAVAAAAGPYGMIPLVPAHMLQGYALPPQYAAMLAAATGMNHPNNTEDEEAEEDASSDTEKDCSNTNVEKKKNNKKATKKQFPNNSNNNPMTSLIPFFPYYLPPYPAAVPPSNTATSSSNSTSSDNEINNSKTPSTINTAINTKLKKEPIVKMETMTTIASNSSNVTTSGINLLAAVSSHYLKDSNHDNEGDVDQEEEV